MASLWGCAHILYPMAYCLGVRPYISGCIPTVEEMCIER
jgi:hypothetical protein